MAEAGEAGIGRMAEPLEIATAALSLLGKDEGDKIACRYAHHRHVGSDP